MMLVFRLDLEQNGSEDILYLCRRISKKRYLTEAVEQGQRRQDAHACEGKDVVRVWTALQADCRIWRDPGLRISGHRLPSTLAVSLATMHDVCAG
jgi:hypothetical protein